MTETPPLESEVRSYCRSFPVVFQKARGDLLYDTNGNRYIDFFAGAGALNYGHNPPEIREAIVEYLMQDGIMHSLDMATTAKHEFMTAFYRTVLEPRKLDYRMQFTGPTGTNAVESALKLARRVKQRRNIIAFTNSYHGLTTGSLAVTAGQFYRNESYVQRQDVSFLPYDGFLGASVDSVHVLERMLLSPSSGIDPPAAVILETLQAEGGVNVASEQWLQSLAAICREQGILLIIDDIQVGCGRTGEFFSFERAGIEPDMVILSKAVSGCGLPMSLLLFKPEWDQWQPGEHTGTFRGNNLAFVAGKEALRLWDSDELSSDTKLKSKYLFERLDAIHAGFQKHVIAVRGRGLIAGIEFADASLAKAVARNAFQKGVIIELCGPESRVLKFLPPLTIDEAHLQEGLAIIDASIQSATRVNSARDEN